MSFGAAEPAVWCPRAARVGGRAFAGRAGVGRSENWLGDARRRFRAADQAGPENRPVPRSAAVGRAPIARAGLGRGAVGGYAAPEGGRRRAPPATAAMLSSPSTNFINRLRADDQAAWFELWETFGPVLRAQLTKWGRGRIGQETVRDLSQETLTALSNSIDRYDPAKGARFSTWLLAIAKHVLGDELDRRGALKRGGGRANALLDESWMGSAPGASVDEQYEAAVFRAKVERAIRQVEKQSDFTEFEIYRMRVFDGLSGKEVAEALGTSEPTVSRKLTKVRDMLRAAIGETVATYSFTAEELAEADRNHLTQNPGGGNPKTDSGKALDVLFDEALAEIYHRQQELRRQDEAGLTD